jgi:hypothetical protein
MHKRLMLMAVQGLNGNVKVPCMHEDGPGTRKLSVHAKISGGGGIAIAVVFFVSCRDNNAACSLVPARGGSHSSPKTATRLAANEVYSCLETSFHVFHNLMNKEKLVTSDCM